MKIIKFFGWLILSIVLIISLLFAQIWYFKPVKISWFYDRAFFQELIQSPITLSSLQLLDKTPFAWYADKLDDFSEAQHKKQFALTQENYSTFKSYPSDSLQGQDKINWLVADFAYKQKFDDEKWHWYGYPFNPLFGMQSQLPDFLINIHPITNQRDIDNYFKRLQALPVAFDQVLEDASIRDEKGLLPNLFAVDKTIAQMKSFIASDAKENALAKNLASKMTAIPASEMSVEQKENNLVKANNIIAQQVYPAYKRVIAHMEGLKKLPLNNDGVWSLPGGKEYYEYAIKTHTTTSLSADQLHELGLSEVQRIGEQIDEILKEQKIPGKNRAEKIFNLAHSKEQLYPDTEQGRASSLADYQKIIDEAGDESKKYFGVLPSTGVVVKRVPEFSQQTAPVGYYQPPSLDGDRPGMFFTNLGKIEYSPKFTMHSLAYHEAIPGHHLQIAIQMKQESIPFFRRATGFTSYVEGWALYAEQLAFEMNLEKNPLDNLGRLQAEMFRAVRLVVDTGMHSKHWSREHAISYMISQTGMGEDEVTIEIERYLVMPGQALAYKVGMIKILSLRETAKKELGEKFKLSEFHDVVLSNGSVPLDVLEVIVKDWIKDNQSH